MCIKLYYFSSFLYLIGLRFTLHHLAHKLRHPNLIIICGGYQAFPFYTRLQKEDILSQGQILPVSLCICVISETTQEVALDCLGRLINLARGGTGNQCFHLLSTPLIAVFNCLNVFIHSHIFYKLYLRVASWTAFLNAASNAVIWILSLPPVDRRCLKISY